MGEPAFGNAAHRSGDEAGKSAGAAWTYILSAVRTGNDPYARMITVWFDERVHAKHRVPCLAILIAIFRWTDLEIREKRASPLFLGLFLKLS